jgi:hypothetical protein
MLRVEPDGELEGLDLFEHGTAAYHVEFGQGMTYSSPAGSGGPLGTKLPVGPPEASDSDDEPVGTSA